MNPGSRGGRPGQEGSPRAHGAEWAAALWPVCREHPAGLSLEGTPVPSLTLALPRGRAPATDRTSQPHVGPNWCLCEAAAWPAESAGDLDERPGMRTEQSPRDRAAGLGPQQQKPTQRPRPTPLSQTRSFPWRRPLEMGFLVVSSPRGLGIKDAFVVTSPLPCGPAAKSACCHGDARWALPRAPLASAALGITREQSKGNSWTDAGSQLHVPRATASSSKSSCDPCSDSELLSRTALCGGRLSWKTPTTHPSSPEAAASPRACRLGEGVGRKGVQAERGCRPGGGAGREGVQAGREGSQPPSE